MLFLMLLILTVIGMSHKFCSLPESHFLTTQHLVQVNSFTPGFCRERIKVETKMYLEHFWYVYNECFRYKDFLSSLQINSPHLFLFRISSASVLYFCIAFMIVAFFFLSNLILSSPHLSPFAQIRLYIALLLLSFFKVCILHNFRHFYTSALLLNFSIWYTSLLSLLPFYFDFDLFLMFIIMSLFRSIAYSFFSDFINIYNWYIPSYQTWQGNAYTFYIVLLNFWYILFLLCLKVVFY